MLFNASSTVRMKTFGTWKARSAPVSSESGVESATIIAIETETKTFVPIRSAELACPRRMAGSIRRALRMAAPADVFKQRESAFCGSSAMRTSVTARSRSVNAKFVAQEPRMMARRPSASFTGAEGESAQGLPPSSLRRARTPATASMLLRMNESLSAAGS